MGYRLSAEASFFIDKTKSILSSPTSEVGFFSNFTNALINFTNFTLKPLTLRVFFDILFKVSTGDKGGDRMALEIEVKVLRDDAGKVNGISFVAGPETYSELFVGEFPNALRGGEATIRLDDDTLILEGPVMDRKFKFQVTAEEAEGLRENLFGDDDGTKLTVEPAEMLTSGFKIVAKQ
jgi:hypothetical protein